MQDYGKTESSVATCIPIVTTPTHCRALRHWLDRGGSRCRSRWTHQRVMSPNRKHCRCMALMSWMTCRIVGRSGKWRSQAIISLQSLQQLVVDKLAGAIPWATEPVNA